MMEIGDLGAEERARMEAQVKGAATDRSLDGILTEASQMLSGLSRGAGVVATSKSNGRLKHVEFVPLDALRALVVLVAEDGSLENRIVQLPAGLPPSALVEASNFLNARIRGRTLAEARLDIGAARDAIESELDGLTASLIDKGFANWGGREDDRHLIVRGQANLLDDVKAAEDIDRIRLLFTDLETQKEVIDLLTRAEGGEGVRIFIGSENRLFSLSGSSMIAAPFRDGAQRIVGVLGVIGPTRLNYSRIVPMVDYTARVVSRLLSGPD
jgi:heat-inducible transcriptional repressor